MVNGRITLFYDDGSYLIQPLCIEVESWVVRQEWEFLRSGSSMCRPGVFEISPDMDRIVLPEVKIYVQRESMINIPFDVNDSFDCLVTTDFAPIYKLQKVITPYLRSEWRPLYVTILSESGY